ncbi:MAG TPA: hypothetical protein VGG61_09115 [Gemmataceae bacterium]
MKTRNKTRRRVRNSPAPDPFSDADAAWCARRDLFYGACQIIEGASPDPKRQAQFRRQKAEMEKRFGYQEPARVTEEFQLSATEIRRMKAAIRRNLKLSEPTWFRAPRKG